MTRRGQDIVTHADIVRFESTANIRVGSKASQAQAKRKYFDL